MPLASPVWWCSRCGAAEEGPSCSVQLALAACNQEHGLSGLCGLPACLALWQPLCLPLPACLSLPNPLRPHPTPTPQV